MPPFWACCSHPTSNDCTAFPASSSRIDANPRSSALYAHKINTLFWHDIDDATHFGFAKHQVTPFNIPTPDGETLYTWHVLPLDVYTRNEQTLVDEHRPDAIVKDITSSSAFKLLRSPEARVVISCSSCQPSKQSSLFH